MSYSYTATHWIRILPDDTREVWQGKPEDAPPHPSDVDCCSVCPKKTWWIPLSDASLLAAVAHLRGVTPCLCVTVTDRDGTLEPAQVALDMSDQDSGRPFMARFSWTMGLPWEPPVTAREVDGRVALFDLKGEKIATAKAGMTAEQALRELRVARY